MTREPDWATADGRVKLYCGDAVRILPELEKVDCVVADPPYGISHVSHGQLFAGFDGIQGDDSTELAEAVLQWCNETSTCCAMWFSPYRPLGKWRNVLCWDKGAHVGIGGDRATCWKRDFELIGVANNPPLNGQRDSAVIRINALSPPPSGHPHEKPVELVEYVLWKIGGELTADPFMGSGTTGVACVRLGRQFIGIEREPRYFEIAVKRIKAELERAPLFEPKPTYVTRNLFDAP